ncbi:MAG: chemotaxis protein CheY, partial [Acetatifactor sp.]|nr:chemotaxis protein CheY [Acetatifactor sp.]
MFSQLFGRYLVDKEIISPEDYQAAVDKQLGVRVKLGTIAVAEGLLTEEQVEMLNKLQMQYDRRFGDLAVEKEFLTQEQVQQLLKKQGNPYMQFLQVLLESGKVNVSQMDMHISSFQKEKGFSDADMTALKNDDFDALVPIFAFSSKPFVTEIVGLVLRNLNRFVTRDFYIGQIRHVDQLEYCYLAGQRTTGDYDLYLAFAEEEPKGGFATLASGFAK